jgi:hypothetical protein
MDGLLLTFDALCYTSLVPGRYFSLNESVDHFDDNFHLQLCGKVHPKHIPLAI